MSCIGSVTASRSVLILAATLPYFVRRRAPLAVYLVTMTAVVVLMLRGYGEGALSLVLLLGAYTVGAWCKPYQVVVGAVATAVLLVTLFVGDAPGFAAGELVASSAAFGFALLIGWTMQTRRQRIDAFDREQREAALRVAADERLRIAQELHDVVAHSLGLIAVQAGVGMKVVDSDRAEAAASVREHLQHEPLESGRDPPVARRATGSRRDPGIRTSPGIGGPSSAGPGRVRRWAGGRPRRRR